MPGFNRDFWEVNISQERWGKFTNEDHPFFEEAEETNRRCAEAARARRLRPQLLEILEDVLTPKQKEVVILYFFRGLNQRQIAERLGISQQVISEHLYGKKRNGRRLGGALRKLRKACEEKGIRLH